MAGQWGCRQIRKRSQTDGLNAESANSRGSTPIVVMEMSEEMHAISLVRAALRRTQHGDLCDGASPDGRSRSGTHTLRLEPPKSIAQQASIDEPPSGTKACGGHWRNRARRSVPAAAKADKLDRAVMSSMGDGAPGTSRRFHLQHARTRAGAGEHGVDDDRSRLHPERFPSSHG